jgi:hypothetical protein
MTYEPKQTPGGFDWAADMQRRIDGGTTPRVERLRKTIAELEAKRPAPATAPPPKRYPPVPLLREATQVAEAIRRANTGKIVSHPGRPERPCSEVAEALVKRGLAERAKLRAKVTRAVKARLKREAASETGV